MSNDQPEHSGSWLSSIIEGGLPQILLGPAGKAISRLVGAAVEIPAARLDDYAAGIRDQTEARSKVAQALSDKAAEIVVDDPAVMDRAIHGMLRRQYQAQENRESVAKIAIENLSEEPPENTEEGPSDDWMNRFERYAEDASSDETRMMFGTILAGEIRKPGNVSFSTLHFVTMLDQATAKLVRRVLPHTTDDGTTFIGCIQPPLSFSEIVSLEQSGFWRTKTESVFSVGDDGVSHSRVREGLGLHFKTSPNKSITLDSSIVSKSGRDLIGIVGVPFDFQSLVDAIWEQEKGILEFSVSEMAAESFTSIQPTKR
jgi:hypothetical protein